MLHAIFADERWYLSSALTVSSWLVPDSLSAVIPSLILKRLALLVLSVEKTSLSERPRRAEHTMDAKAALSVTICHGSALSRIHVLSVIILLLREATSSLAQTTSAITSSNSFYCIKKICDRLFVGLSLFIFICI